MKEITVYTVDAFTSTTFKGNPAGVVYNAPDLSIEEMTLIAREINLSETAFINKSEAGKFRVRYFTPVKEIDFCGHATVASAWILLTEIIKNQSEINEILFETNIGIVPIKWEIENNKLKSVVMTQVEPKVKDIDYDINEIAQLIGMHTNHIDIKYPIKLAYTGNWHLLIPIKSKEAIDQARPDFERLGEHNANLNVSTTHLFTLNTENEEFLLYTRDFAPSSGINEDPVTGSANGALAGLLILENIIEANNSFKILQNNQLNRTGELLVKTSMDQNKVIIKVGGSAVKVFEGKMFLS